MRQRFIWPTLLKDPTLPLVAPSIHTNTTFMLQHLVALPLDRDLKPPLWPGSTHGSPLESQVGAWNERSLNADLPVNDQLDPGQDNPVESADFAYLPPSEEELAQVILPFNCWTGLDGCEYVWISVCVLCMIL